MNHNSRMKQSLTCALLLVTHWLLTSFCSKIRKKKYILVERLRQQMSKPVEFRLILLLEVDTVEYIPDCLTVFWQILNFLLVLLLWINPNFSKYQLWSILFLISLVNYWKLDYCYDMGIGGLLIGKGSVENWSCLLLVLCLKCCTI